MQVCIEVLNTPITGKINVCIYVHTSGLVNHYESSSACVHVPFNIF